MQPSSGLKLPLHKHGPSLRQTCEFKWSLECLRKHEQNNINCSVSQHNEHEKNDTGNVSNVSEAILQVFAQKSCSRKFLPVTIQKICLVVEQLMSSFSKYFSNYFLEHFCMAASDYTNLMAEWNWGFPFSKHFNSIKSLHELICSQNTK